MVEVRGVLTQNLPSLRFCSHISNSILKFEQLQG